MKFGKIENLISEDLRKQMIDLMDLLKDHSMHIKDDCWAIGKEVPAYYGIFNMVQLKILPEIEKAFEKELVPTYNYSRIYYDGSILEKHRDRKACEYSVTINLYQEKDIWPIYMKYDNNLGEIKLEPGSAAWYKGCEVTHWREKNVNGIGYQSFMHYVEKNGKYSDQIYDKDPENWQKDLNNPIYQLDF